MKFSKKHRYDDADSTRITKDELMRMRTGEVGFSDDSWSKPCTLKSSDSKAVVEKKKNSKRQKHIFLKTLLILIVAGFAVLFLFASGDLNSNLEDTKTLEKYGISDNAANVAKAHRIVNIAIFGIDGRDGVSGNRTDALLICSADFEHGSIKISSVMRDCYAWIESEEGYDKINAAFAYDGPEGTIRALNQNFDIAITDYIIVDFNSMLEIVNSVGGVTVNISDPEVLAWTNEYVEDVNASCGTCSEPLSGLGTQLLDGSQALAYCRVRYTGNGDFDRATRQREVLQCCITKALDLNPFKQFQLIRNTLPYIETSLSIKQIARDGINLLTMNGHKMTQKQLPTSEFCFAAYYEDVSYIFPDTLADSIKAFYKYVYQEYDYELSPTAKEINDHITGMFD